MCYALGFLPLMYLIFRKKNPDKSSGSHIASAGMTCLAIFVGVLFFSSLSDQAATSAIFGLAGIICFIAALPFFIKALSNDSRSKKVPNTENKIGIMEAKDTPIAVELELKKYRQMVNDGLISEEDYEKKKKRILGI